MFPLIRDIIDVPVVETVVRLDDAGNPARGGVLAGEFVITRQVERNLMVIAESIKEGVGRGHFLIGPYGSGKSHFLSYLSIVLAGEARLSGTSCPLAKAARGKRFFPVRVSLVKVRGETRLEEALLGVAETELVRAGQKISLTAKSRFLEHVDCAIRVVDAGGMDSYLKRKNFPVWEELKKDRDRAAVAAWGYVKSLSGCPALPDIGPESLLQDIVRASRALGFEGVVIVIDELSEFLRSKRSGNHLSEDARYLQLLGEFAKTQPFWIVASLQEAIEQAGDIERGVLAKIKDRYPATLSLGESHIRDLIEGRIIRKRDGARDVVRSVWRRFCECIPSFKTDFEDFYRVYPLHPSTIEYLEGLSPLLSAHRGVVDFIVTQIRGDTGRAVTGVLDSTVDRLVTADAIYSHFGDRIRNDDRYAPFDTLVKADIEMAIQKKISDDSDRLLARRACDVLILNEIAALERPKTVSELAAILLSVISDASPEANEEYLSDVILKPIAAESLFLRHEGAKKVGDGVFRVSLKRESRGLLEREIKVRLADLKDTDSRPARAAIESVSLEIPVRETLEGAHPEFVVQWCGTGRRGIFLWAGAVSPAESGFLINKGNYDFAIALGLLRSESPDGEKYPDRVIEWIPSWNDEEVALIRRYYAIKMTESGELVERAVRQEARDALEGMKDMLVRTIESGFRRGKFFWRGAETTSCSVTGTVGFIEKHASFPVIQAMKQIHPRFLEVAPQVDFVSRRALMPLVDAIIVPGRVSMAAARKNGTRTMIEGVLIPMGFARVDGPSYVMQLDSSQSVLAREVLDRAHEHPKVSDLVSDLKRGPFGLSSEMAQLAIVALVRGGMLDLKKDGRRIPATIVGFEHVDDADEIGAGELLSAELRDRLFEDRELARGLDAGSFSLSSQRDAWERLLAVRARFETHVAETLPRLLSISQYPVFDSFDFEKIRTAIERGFDAVRGVHESQGASKGLGKYLSSGRPDLAELLGIADAAWVFVDRDAERVVHIARYLADMPPAECMPKEISDALADIETGFSGLTESVVEGRTADITVAFDRFWEMYSVWYAECHRRAFAREHFEPLHKLKESDEWKALSVASSISGIHLVDSSKAVGALIDAAMSSRCTASLSAELKFRAKCCCGFVPDVEVVLPSEKGIKAQVLAGLSEALSALREPQIMERLVARLAVIRDIDPVKSERLEKIFHLIREGCTVRDFISHLTPEIGSLLSEALERVVSVIGRDVEGLVERLSGRRLPPKRIRGIFEEWLGDPGEGDVVVEIHRGSETTCTEDEGLAGWVSDHGFDESAARLALVISPDAKAAGEGVRVSVGNERLKRMVEVSGLAHMSVNECMALFLKEERSEAFALEVARRVANHVVEGSRPEPEKPVKSGFANAERWCASILEATVPICEGPAQCVLKNESRRISAVSFIREHFERHAFPCENEVARLCAVAAAEVAKRDALFASLPPPDFKFDDLLVRYPDAAFIFIDAASFALLADFGALTGRILKMKQNSESWFRVSGATTAAWQEIVFGTSDVGAIAAVFRMRGVRYAGDADFARGRARLKEDSGCGPLWIRLGFVDRLIHSTVMPLFRIHEEAAREFTEVMTDIEPAVRGRSRVVLLSDHGFSEVKNAPGGSRYRHDPSNVADAVSAVISFER